MSESYVYISYSRRDRSFVERLKTSLQKAGVRTWMDIEDILPGQGWAKATERGLDEASALIYVANKYSAQSDLVQKECYRFFQKKNDRKIIPIILDMKVKLPLLLTSYQFVDFTGPFKPAFDRLLDGIKELRSPVSLPPSKQKSKGYVFISYADEDVAFISDLKIFLKNHGYGYWDFRESQRDYQADYTLELENIIKDAAGTLSIVSPDWKRSPTALQELHFSREVQTPVFLLKVRDPGPTLAISGMTYIDFIKERKDGFAQLDGEMRRKGL